MKNKKRTAHLENSAFNSGTGWEIWKIDGENTRIRITYNCGLQNEARYMEYAHGGIDLGSRIGLNDLDRKFEFDE